MLDPAVAIVIRIALGVLFGVAVLHKLRHPTRFGATMVAYDLVPGAVARLLAAAVVAAEAAIVLGLGLGRQWAPILATGMLMAYALALGANLARGRRDIDCGCVGAAGRDGLSWWLVSRNLMVAVVALGLVVAPTPRALVWIDGVTIVGALAAVGLLYAAGDLLLANRPAVARARGLA